MIISRNDLLALIEEWIDTSQVASPREETAHSAYYELVHYRKEPDHVLFALQAQIGPLMGTANEPYGLARQAFVTEANSLSVEEVDVE